MRSFAEDNFQLEAAAGSGPLAIDKPAALKQPVQSIADRAAAAGFVLSMAFLAVSALYALSLSDAVRPFFAEAAAIADRSAYDAGFRLEDLALSGARNAPQTAIFEALELPYRGSSIFYDAADAHDRLLRLGWIESAAVRRILPSRLEVRVSERTPFARWEDQTHTVQVIDREGHVLGPDTENRFSSMPLFSGDEAPQLAFQFEDALDAHYAIKSRILYAELVASRFWSVKFEGGLTVKLPRKVTPLALERLDSLLASPKVAEMALDTIDLRLANRTILQLRDPSETNRDRAIARLFAEAAQMQGPMRKGRAS